MGVLGLWQILESVGHPIKLEGLEGKRLGVDANVWLYKFIRGFRDKDNAAAIDSHKLGLFNRICKLLFYKIKPVFVFDGPAPALKRRTLERRQNIRSKHLMKVQGAAMKILAEQLKKHYPDAKLDDLTIQVPQFNSNGLVAAEKLTDEDASLFYLPPEQPKKEEEQSSDESHDEVELVNFATSLKESKIDLESKEFKSMPAEMRYEILQDLKEDRKRIRNSGTLPDDAESFSNFQLSRLKARRSIQEKIEECEKDICSIYTGECDGRSISSYRMQSDPTSRMIYIQNQGKSESSQVLSATSSSSQVSKILGQQSETNDLRKEKLNETIVLSTCSSQSSTASTCLYEYPNSSQKQNVEEASTQPGSNLISSNESDDEVEVIDFNSLKRQHEESDADDESTEFESIPDEVTSDIVQERHQEHSNNSDALFEEAESVSNNQLSESESDNLFGDSIHEGIGSSNSSERGNKSVSPILAHSAAGKEPPRAAESITDQLTEPEVNKSFEDNIDDDIGLPRQHENDDRPISTLPMQTGSGKEPIQNQEKLHETVILSSSSSQSSSGSTGFYETPLSTQRKFVDEESTQPTNSIPATEKASSHQEGPSRFANLATLINHDSATSNRMANKVTTKIVEESKELLRLFGIPYVDAAGEAEAQCALLEELNLTEGTITDDSDIWLFGAKNVYRYFFSDDKYVMQYKLNDIEYHLRLTRQELVCFAMLVGSDYTDGIMNVGPVNALEIISEFPGDGMESLIKFKQWRDTHTKKSEVKVKHRKFLKFQLPEGFPSRTVFEGYMRPVADTSTEQFSWGLPDLDELREYARRNFGWDSRKIDEKLLPVMKKLSERKTQPTIDSFFFKTAANQNPELFRSKRVNQALSKLAKQDDVVMLSEDDEDDHNESEQEDNDVAAKKDKSKKTVRGRGTSKNTTKNKTKARAAKKSRPKSESANKPKRQRRANQDA